MKKAILNLVNSMLSPLGMTIVKSHKAQFTMRYALERIAKRGSNINTVIDIGASNGKWSLMAMHNFPGALVVGIEPLQERQAELEALKKANPHFDYILSVAGNEDGIEVAMNVSPDLDGSMIGGTGGMTRNVPARTIDSIVAEKKLKGPFLLKFDTHGYELPILSGCKETLADTEVVIMEVYNFNLNEISLRFPEMCLHLEELGFRCCDLVDPLLRPNDAFFWQTDMVFCRSTSKSFSHRSYL